MDTHKVYILVDENRRIKAINSDVFLSNATNWLLIDEGTGDKYHHAQGNYLNKPIMDDDGVYNYKFVNNEIQERSNEEKAADISSASTYVKSELELKVEQLQVENEEIQNALVELAGLIDRGMRYG